MPQAAVGFTASSGVLKQLLSDGCELPVCVYIYTTVLNDTSHQLYNELVYDAHAAGGYSHPALVSRHRRGVNLLKQVLKADYN